MFHFISLNGPINGKWTKGVDFTEYKIIGYLYYMNYYLQNNKDLSKFDHWIYGKCNNDSDTKGIGYLIDYEYFENSGCIRKFFNSAEQKYSAFSLTACPLQC